MGLRRRLILQEAKDGSTLVAAECGPYGPEGRMIRSGGVIEPWAYELSSGTRRQVQAFAARQALAELRSTLEQGWVWNAVLERMEPIGKPL